MIYHSHKKYLRALDRYNQTLGKIINGEGFYVIGGELIPDKEYFNHNSRPVYEPMPRKNSDKTSIPPSVKIKKS